MKIIEIEGARELSGTIRVSGAKNATVALIPAAILTDEEATICNVPEITDTEALCDILKMLNVKVSRASESIVINPETMENLEITEEFSKKLRASYYFMGALLGKYKKAVMYFPGGCSIGARPIDLHLKGFEALGAKITKDKDIIQIDADQLIGDDIYLDIASVGATINIMLAACFAKGKTTIENAAKEPEIIDVSSMLNKMGAKIRGAGTSEITIQGVTRLKGCIHDIIPDRIEAGTYIIAAAAVGENVTVNNVIPQHIEALTSKLEEMGVNLEIGSDYVKVIDGKNLKAVDIITQPFPGFATDLQQPLTTLLTQAKGDSHIEETLYLERFRHCDELNLMGANIEHSTGHSLIHGPTKLKGCEITARDLRCGAALIIAGLIAEGETTINDAYHIYRGYDSIVEKLANLGADIE